MGSSSTGCPLVPLNLIHGAVSDTEACNDVTSETRENVAFSVSAPFLLAVNRAAKTPAG